MSSTIFPLKLLLVIILCGTFGLLWTPPDGLTRGSGSSRGGGGHSSGQHTYRGQSHSQTSPSVPRDSHGRIKRSSTAKTEFKKAHPCPSTGKATGACPGYVIDHVTPLKRGGKDAPENMQWQTKEEAKLKDRTE